MVFCKRASPMYFSFERIPLTVLMCHLYRFPPKYSRKSSVKKYQVIQNAVCNDHRTRGMFQFYGANRTGHWAGRLIQLQNLPQNHIWVRKENAGIRQRTLQQELSLIYEQRPDTNSPVAVFLISIIVIGWTPGFIFSCYLSPSVNPALWTNSHKAIFKHKNKGFPAANRTQ